MKKYILIFVVNICLISFTLSQNSNALKFRLVDDGSHFFQVTFLNQAWLRYNQSNPGTLVEGLPKSETFDIGLRRTRIQMFGQITDKVFIYFQFGQNNFNSQFNSTSNRKLAPFFHDALCEYKISKGNELKLGGGLTIANGLSRFSQPSVTSIMTLDVPVFAQATVDKTDQFSRKLSVYARGQFKKIDYRFILSDPFPISSSGSVPSLSVNSDFAGLGHYLQQQAYISYNFFDEENHTTPYMTGTYLGKKKVFNIGAGFIFQKNAMWRQDSISLDTLYENMQHLAFESYLDIPINKDKGTALNAYVGFFMMNYGKNYLRYNGLMNPSNGTNLNASNSISGHGPVYGNAYPMFGSGNIIYAQIGYLLPKMKNGQQFLPYASTTFAQFDRLDNISTVTMNVGINYLINGHQSKITLDWQNRPSYKVESNIIKNDKRLNCIILQYQIFI